MAIAAVSLAVSFAIALVAFGAGYFFEGPSGVVLGVLAPSLPALVVSYFWFGALSSYSAPWIDLIQPLAFVSVCVVACYLIAKFGQGRRIMEDRKKGVANG